MIASTGVSSPDWNGRRRLLPKSTAYVFSLDLSLEMVEQSLVRPSSWPADRPLGESYHLLGRRTVTDAAGDSQLVPNFTVRRGSGLLVRDSGPNACTLSMQLTLTGQSGEILLVNADGVLSFPGGVGALPGTPDGLPGRAFVSTQHEGAVAAYRWLTRCQLYGIGRVTVQAQSGQPRSPRLQMAFDLYSAL